MSWQNQIKVELLDVQGTDASIANAARVSFQGDGEWNTLPEGYTQEQMERLIKYLANHKHMTPFRHVNVSIRCTAPVWLARQLVKHQAGLTWSEVSRRYVDTPIELFNQEFRARPDGGIKQGSAGVLASTEIPSLTTGHDIQDTMEAMLQWYDDCIAQGVAPETVRGYMPLNMMTSWVWTGNLMAFHHMYNLRADAHAQIEAQHFANMTADVIKPMFPIAWDALSGVKKWEREQMLKGALNVKD